MTLSEKSMADPGNRNFTGPLILGMPKNLIFKAVMSFDD
jgi:hypothetical protein